GLIFTTDAILALAVVIVLTASLMTYFYAPVYMGADHQHLEELADSALAVMEQDGTLTNAAVESHKGNITGAQLILNSRLRMLIPQEVAYNLTLSTPNLVTVENDRGINFAQDTVTKVRVLSFPREGWMGRAWYKIEKFEFEDQEQNVTTTLWNFHNWLTNFAPWSGGNLATRPLWGSTAAAPTTPLDISFSFPTGSTIKGAKYLSGSCSRNTTTLIQAPSFGTNFTLNSQVYTANSTQYTFLYRRPSQNYPMYNYQGNITPAHLANSNSFNLRFISPVFNYVNDNNQGNDMPWFSIIGNYSTSFPVPKGIVSTTNRFPDGAGMAVRVAQDLGGGPAYGRIYNLSTGSVSNLPTLREITWNNFRLRDASNVGGVNYQNGVPFVMTNVAGASGTSVTATKCAVSVSQTINVPTGNTIFDAFTVVNPYGGVDGALVEVYNGSTWRTVFCSFNYDGASYSDRPDGYGNIPGIIYIPPNYLSVGQNNQVRVTIWDDVPSTDYDLVGLVDCYSKVTYSALNIGWVTTPYTSYQSNNNVRTETKSFNIEENAKNVYLFVGTGLDTRNITVNYPGGATLYANTTLPYYLDLAALDAGLPVAQRKITTANSTPALYWLKTGTNYNLTVTVNGPPSTQPWQSGDWDGNAEIFSGTRISVIYPETLRNVWTDAYDDNAVTAMAIAKQKLITSLNITGLNESAIKTEALFTGDLPNQVPVRLSLWRQ
ncbi:MAG: hypothetical protein Q8M92_09040, partial [Candidatus Subteraquimicrobiales bacterium]|nr:hypothetical protein [Candidatus Subteraquimicrobiales bacterium]